MPYEKDYLDRIRSAIKVSEVVGRKFKLRKNGAEFVAVEDPSISVNDRKGIWHDFGSHTEGGDIFEFLQAHEGYTFPQAVDELAEKAGIHKRSDRRARGNGSPASYDAGRSGSDYIGEGSAAYGDGNREREAGSKLPPSKKEICATFDYTDQKGALIYQVVRLQKKLDDGSWEMGKNRKPWKSFAQRRKSPDLDGTWVWGLDFVDRETSAPLEFMRKGPGRDWIRFDEGDYERWRFTERRMFPGIGNVDHWLYNASDVLDELREDTADQRTIFLPEGEGKVEILKEWDLLGTTNSGGAKHFTQRLAEVFLGAGDLVVLEDNDPAGRARTALIAPMLRRVGARVRVLNFQSVWPQCPMRGDIKDWRDHGAGTRSALLEIVDKLPEWTPEPYRSKFGAVRWRDQYSTKVRVYDWTIKGLIPFGKSVLIYGESQCGKSFETLEMAMAPARGITFAGRKCKPVGVVYCAAEKGEGFVNRMHAYEKANELGRDSDLPFVVLTKSLDLWTQEETTDVLIEEMKALAADWTVPLGVVVLDTYQAASPGASIIKDEDVTTMYRRAKKIMDATGAGVWFVHHKNAHGTIRGSLVLWNSIETTIEIDSRKLDRQGTEMRDDDNRVIRRATVRKQSEGVKGDHWDFVLKRVVIGKDSDGDDITSCVVSPPNLEPVDSTEKKEGARADGFALSEINATIFRALLKAIDEDGFAPPGTMKLPRSVNRIAKWEDVRRRYKSVTPNNELGDTPADQHNNFKGRTGRFRRLMMNTNIVAMDEVVLTQGQPPESVIWPTGKRVTGRGLQGGWPARVKRPDDEVTTDKATGLPLEFPNESNG